MLNTRPSMLGILNKQPPSKFCDLQQAAYERLSELEELVLPECLYPYQKLEQFLTLSMPRLAKQIINHPMHLPISAMLRNDQDDMDFAVPIEIGCIESELLLTIDTSLHAIWDNGTIFWYWRMAVSNDRLYSLSISINALPKGYTLLTESSPTEPSRALILSTHFWQTNAAYLL